MVECCLWYNKVIIQKAKEGEGGAQMARYKEYNYNQMRLLAVSLQYQLMPGTLEFAIHELLDSRVDTFIFEEDYSNDITGRKAYDPKILLKVVLMAYSRGILTSRKIERACKENVTFMALSCCQQPDHSTIAAFISSMEDRVASIFSNILLVSHEEKLLGGTHFSLDGVKLSSNASKEWSGKHSELRGKQKKLEEKVRQAVRQHKQADKREDDGGSEKERRERRIKRLRQRAERIEEFLQENDQKIGSKNKEIKNNVTDPESAYMKTSHGMQQGYNAQALVDSRGQIIIHAEASSQPQDFKQMESVLPHAKQTAKEAGLGKDYFEGKILSADSNYHSEKNLKTCEEEKIDAYIPDTQFRKRDMRFESRDRHKPKREQKFNMNDFIYDAKKDTYICKNGKALTMQSASHKIGMSLFRSYRSKERDCKGCQYTGKCFKRKNGLRKSLAIMIGRIGENYSDKMREKIDTLRGRKIYEKRLAIVEPAFANIGYHKGMNRFTLRGLKKVDIQWKLYCIVHNIGKISTLAMAT